MCRVAMDHTQLHLQSHIMCTVAQLHSCTVAHVSCSHGPRPVAFAVAQSCVQLHSCTAAQLHMCHVAMDHTQLYLQSHSHDLATCVVANLLHSRICTMCTVAQLQSLHSCTCVMQPYHTVMTMSCIATCKTTCLIVVQERMPNSASTCCNRCAQA